MVLLPKNGGNPLKKMLADFEIWRDGGPINLTLQAPQFACEITHDFRSQDDPNMQFTQGMQGRLLEESNNAAGLKMALIFIQGVTPKNTWVPRSYIKVGVQLTGNINDEKIEFTHEPNLKSSKPRENSDKPI